jgi:FdhD protein
MDELRLFLEIMKYKKGKAEFASDIVIREIPFRIFINQKLLVTISALPSDLQELGTGFLWSEGLITDLLEIKDVQFDPQKKFINFNLNIPTGRIRNFQETGEKTSGCGSSLSAAIDAAEVEYFSLKTLEAERILTLMKEFTRSSRLFGETGGVHIAGLIKNYKIIYFAEDIGRHNAVDKVAGKAIKDRENLKEYILFCSGRISSEIVKKAVRLHIPLIISKSAPTSEAIRLGWEYKVNLIGFARNERMNLYTGITELTFT